MRRLCIIILLFIGINLSAQDTDTIKLFNNAEVTLHMNFRTPKIDTFDFDWFISASERMQIKDFMEFYIYGSIERDNEVIYHAFKTHIKTDYTTIKYIYDNEKDFNVLSSSVYYPFWDIIKIGMDYSIKDSESLLNVYTGIEWKWVNIECAFLDDIERFNLELNPNLVIKDKYNIGYKASYAYVNDKGFKWETGLTLKISLN